MKKSTAAFIIALWGLVCAAHAEFRVWSSKDGISNVEAQFIQMAGNKVVLEKKDGTRVMVPRSKLCDKDQEYLASIVPPEIAIKIDKDTSTEKTSESYYTEHKRDTIVIKVSIKKSSKDPCTQKFKATLYVVAGSYSGGSSRVIATTDKSFSFEKDDAIELKASGSVEYSNSYSSGKSGEEYEGYIVVVEDEKGQVVKVDTNKSVYQSKLNEIKNNKNGKNSFTL